MPRIHYKDWQYYPNNWMWYYYGQHADREKLRGLIYNYRPYIQEFADLNEYDLIAFSLNFDNYPSDFQKFVTSVINDLYKQFPFLHNKEVIIMAGNEVQEKRGSTAKVFETCFDTKKGIEKSVKSNLPVCGWNQKVRTDTEVKMFNKLLTSDLMKSTCKYIGIQSLESRYLGWGIVKAQLAGFETIDVELGTKTSDFNSIKDLFDIDKANQVNKVFIMCPYISQELANYDKNFKKYALSINGDKKDKYKLIKYIQQFKSKEEGMKIADEYKLNDKGDRVIDWIQAQLFYEGHLAHPIDFGNFNIATEKAVKAWQKANVLEITGVITKYHISVLVERSKDKNKAFRQLMIYAS